jgi:hypothetical protein
MDAQRRPNRIRRTLVALVAALAAVAALPQPAGASKLIDRNATDIRLAVDRSGTALVSYRVQGRVRHVLAWGAINARMPAGPQPQVRFKLDYSGGYGRSRRAVWKTFSNGCRAYDGPALPWLVHACKAADGSYWALQRWQVALPDLGFVPWLPAQAAWELHLSHWSGAIAVIEASTDWVYSGRFHEIFGRATYQGVPIYGFHTTRYGAPTDGYGRLLYLDTHGSAYGPGWRRENSFVTHKTTGAFCYGFFGFDPSTGGYAHPPGYPEHKLRPPGQGDRYRMTMEGPGVSPDVMWTGDGLPSWDPRNPALVQREQQMNAALDQLGDRLCRHH